MAIITSIEARTGAGKAVRAAIYGILIVGGIMVLYPFLMMLRMSTVDYAERDRIGLIPEFWWSKSAIARKYLTEHYREDYSPRRASFPRRGVVAQTGLYRTFLADDFYESNYSFVKEYSEEAQVTMVRDFIDFKSGLSFAHFVPLLSSLDPEFETLHDYLGRMTGERVSHFTRLESMYDMGVRRDWQPNFDERWDLMKTYIENSPGEFRILRERGLSSWAQFLKDTYGRDLEVGAPQYIQWVDYGKTQRMRTKMFSAPPEEPQKHADYFQWLDEYYPRYLLTIGGDYQAAWQEYLRESENIRTPEIWQKRTGLSVEAMSDIQFTAQMPSNFEWALIWQEFVNFKVSPTDMKPQPTLLELEIEFLKERYGTLEALNTTWEKQFPTWGDVNFELARYIEDHRYIEDNRWRLVFFFTFHYFADAFDLLFIETDSAKNSFYLMLMAFCTALVINPAAAYALSRFKMRGKQQILFFILATLAIPAEISMAPSFVLLRELGLMNNLWAVILPTAANAFSIFLMKTFFDSIPRELFESALIEGATEWDLFRHVTFPMGKPIVALTVMTSVVAAYSSFLPAILYLHDEEMWPVVVNLYRFAFDAPFSDGVSMAALTLASIPTLVIYFFCQRIIVNGIILPKFD